MANFSGKIRVFDLFSTVPVPGFWGTGVYMTASPWLTGCCHATCRHAHRISGMRAIDLSAIVLNANHNSRAGFRPTRARAFDVLDRLGWFDTLAAAMFPLCNHLGRVRCQFLNQLFRIEPQLAAPRGGRQCLAAGRQEMTRR